MLAPLILLILSLAGVGASLALLGPDPGLPLIVAGLSAFAALVLLISARMRERSPYLVIDGSNVMFWDANTPSLATVAGVAAHASRHGYRPVIWFDANAGYRVEDRYLGAAQLARRIGVPARQVFVAPKGTSADPLLLQGAETLGASVVTNDRFRDWIAAHPGITEPGFLRRGQVRDGRLVLDLAP